MKKSAFSYLELIIAMGLIVVIIILTAPVMTSMAKKSNHLYGEYKCYARLVDNKWKLFENERVNSDTYSVTDNEIAEDSTCKFTKPAGNISSFTVTIYGGGGSGSMPYFDTAKTETIDFAPGNHGEAGEEKTVSDSLMFNENGEMIISLCDDTDSIENCVGKGGEVNYEEISKAPRERVLRIKYNLEEGEMTSSDIDYLQSGNNNIIKNALSAYLSDKSTDNRTKLINSLNSYNGIPDNSKYTGNSGKPSGIILSGGKYITALGGKYGVSDKYTDVKPFKIFDFTQSDANIYYYPIESNPSVSDGVFKDCDGQNANNPSDVDEYTNYGVGGGGGVFICKIKNQNNLNLLNTKDNITSGTENSVYNDSVSENQCYKGYGGAGAGGAIVIQWN